MLTAFNQKLTQALKSLLPLETALVLVLLSVEVWPLPYLGGVSPSLTLAAVTYWAIYRPDLFRPSLAFALGLIHDILNLLPFGLSAFIFVGIYQLAFSQRRLFVRQYFFMLWAGFAVMALLASAANWVGLSLWNRAAMPLVPALIQLGLTIVLFPLPAWILIRLQRAFLPTGDR